MLDLFVRLGEPHEVTCLTVVLFLLESKMSIINIPDSVNFMKLNLKFFIMIYFLSFQLSLMFANKVGAYPSGAPFRDSSLH